MKMGSPPLPQREKIDTYYLGDLIDSLHSH